MTFPFYLSVLSCLHVLKLKAVYIHGGLPPPGLHWPKFLKERVQRVQWMFIAQGNLFAGHPLH